MPRSYSLSMDLSIPAVLRSFLQVRATFHHVNLSKISAKVDLIQDGFLNHPPPYPREKGLI